MQATGIWFICPPSLGPPLKPLVQGAVFHHPVSWHTVLIVICPSPPDSKHEGLSTSHPSSHYRTIFRRHESFPPSRLSFLWRGRVFPLLSARSAPGVCMSPTSSPSSSSGRPDPGSRSSHIFKKVSIHTRRNCLSPAMRLTSPPTGQTGFLHAYLTELLLCYPHDSQPVVCFVMCLTPPSHPSALPQSSHQRGPMRRCCVVCRPFLPRGRALHKAGQVGVVSFSTSPS